MEKASVYVRRWRQKYPEKAKKLNSRCSKDYYNKNKIAIRQRMTFNKICKEFRAIDFS